MTQSIFRQLPEWDLVNENEVELRGNPWGWVNYRFGELDPKATQFIAEHNGALYRCPVLIRPSYSFEREPMRPAGLGEILEELQRLAEAFHYARILEGWRPATDDGWPRTYRAKGVPIDIRLKALHPSLFYLREEFAPGAKPEERERYRRDSLDSVKLTVENRMGKPATADEIRPPLEAQSETAADFCRRWDALMADLTAIPQLFIAV